MTARPTVEVVLLKLNSGVSDADFVEATAAMLPDLQSTPGFIRRELLKAEDGQWIDVIHWQSLPEALQAAETIMSWPNTQRFIQMIDPSSITMMHLDQVYTAP